METEIRKYSLKTNRTLKFGYDILKASVEFTDDLNFECKSTTGDMVLTLNVNHPVIENINLVHSILCRELLDDSHTIPLYKLFPSLPDKWFALTNYSASPLTFYPQSHSDLLVNINDTVTIAYCSHPHGICYTRNDLHMCFYRKDDSMYLDDDPSGLKIACYNEHDIYTEKDTTVKVGDRWYFTNKVKTIVLDKHEPIIKI